MRPKRPWMRGIAMLFGPALLAGLGTPAHAADAEPGKLSGADIAAQVMGGAIGGDDSGPGGMLMFALFGVVPLALGAMRLSRGVFRASRVITKTGTLVRSSESFEDRLAAKLRELEPKGQAPTPPPPPAAPVVAMPPTAQRPAAPVGPAPRTFGRRV